MIVEGIDDEDATAEVREWLERITLYDLRDPSAWAALPVIVPVVVGLPSPQSIVAEYSLADAEVSGSVNVATVPLKE